VVALNHDLLVFLFEIVKRPGIVESFLVGLVEVLGGGHSAVVLAPFVFEHDRRQFGGSFLDYGFSEFTRLGLNEVEFFAGQELVEPDGRVAEFGRVDVGIKHPDHLRLEASVDVERTLDVLEVHGADLELETLAFEENLVDGEFSQDVGLDLAFGVLEEHALVLLDGVDVLVLGGLDRALVAVQVDLHDFALVEDHVVVVPDQVAVEDDLVQVEHVALLDQTLDAVLLQILLQQLLVLLGHLPRYQDHDFVVLAQTRLDLVPLGLLDVHDLVCVVEVVDQEEVVLHGSELVEEGVLVELFEDEVGLHELEEDERVALQHVDLVQLVVEDLFEDLVPVVLLQALGQEVEFVVEHLDVVLDQGLAHLVNALTVDALAVDDVVEQQLQFLVHVVMHALVHGLRDDASGHKGE